MICDLMLLLYGNGLNLMMSLTVIAYDLVQASNMFKKVYSCFFHNPRAQATNENKNRIVLTWSVWTTP